MPIFICSIVGKLTGEQREQYLSFISIMVSEHSVPLVVLARISRAQIQDCCINRAKLGKMLNFRLGL